MKVTRNLVGISKLILILLLFIAAIVGAILSYMWTIGYYISLESQPPETPTVTVTDVTFDPQDPTFFRLSLLNPSFSPFDANITKVMASTEEGVLNDVVVDPAQPTISIGEAKTVKCFWNWADHTNENVKVHVFVADGSGATFQAKTPLVKLIISEVFFNSTIGVTQFNVTVQNSASSVTYVDISGVAVDSESIQNVTPSLPYGLNPNASVAFVCPLNWTDHQGKEVTVKVETSQGYMASRTHMTPQPVILAISDVLFNITETSSFSFVVQNNASSPTHVNVDRITVNVDETTEEITELNVTLPYVLHPDSKVTFVSSWNWADYQGMAVTIIVHTRQGFETRSEYTLPEG